MNGDGFKALVKEGQRVKRGEKLITFDPEKIKAAGHPLTTMLVVTDDAGQALRFQPGQELQAGQGIIAEIGE